MAIGPNCRATGLIEGYVSMRRIVRQGRPRGRRIDSAAGRGRLQLLARELNEALERGLGLRGRPNQARLTPGDLLRLLSPDLPVDDARPLKLPHALGHPGH